MGKLFKNKDEFMDFVDTVNDNFDLFASAVADLDYQMEEVIEALDELLADKKYTEDNAFAMASLLDYFNYNKQQLQAIDKFKTKCRWHIEPYFEEFEDYCKDEYLENIALLQGQIDKYNPILEAQIAKCEKFLHKCNIEITF